LLAANQYLGVFILSSTEEIIWEEAQIRWLGSIGRQMGVIIHHAQIVEQLKVSAALEERVRLSRELHDSLVQVLGYLNLKSQVAQAQLSSEEIDQALVELRAMEAVSARAYDDVRDSIFGLRIELSPNQELVSALEEYVRGFGDRSRIEIALDIEDWAPDLLPPATQVQLLRIIQEALTNVQRHAQASRVWLTLRADGDQVFIRIRDDGRGFDPVGVAREGCRHLGLQTMRERAESVGGCLKIHSQPGQGTEVLFKLLLDRPGGWQVSWKQ
jgi:two-component system nitrate/nitrite sensor histidine kinase NarX